MKLKILYQHNQMEEILKSPHKHLLPQALAQTHNLSDTTANMVANAILSPATSAKALEIITAHKLLDAEITIHNIAIYLRLLKAKKVDRYDFDITILSSLTELAQYIEANQKIIGVVKNCLLQHKLHWQALQIRIEQKVIDILWMDSVIPMSWSHLAKAAILIHTFIPNKQIKFYKTAIHKTSTLDSLQNDGNSCAIFSLFFIRSLIQDRTNGHQFDYWCVKPIDVTKSDNYQLITVQIPNKILRAWQSRELLSIDGVYQTQKGPVKFQESNKHLFIQDYNKPNQNLLIGIKVRSKIIEQVFPYLLKSEDIPAVQAAALAEVSYIDLINNGKLRERISTELETLKAIRQRQPATQQSDSLLAPVCLLIPIGLLGLAYYGSLPQEAEIASVVVATCIVLALSSKYYLANNERQI